MNITLFTKKGKKKKSNIQRISQQLNWQTFTSFHLGLPLTFIDRLEGGGEVLRREFRFPLR